MGSEKQGGEVLIHSQIAKRLKMLTGVWTLVPRRGWFSTEHSGGFDLYSGVAEMPRPNVLQRRSCGPRLGG